jgi:ubiquinone/menaquinone biosynthesis C-methylase UbiE
MSRRSRALVNPPMAPSVTAGFKSLIHKNKPELRSMLDLEPSNNNILDALRSVMRVNSLTPEMLLSSYFPDVMLSEYLISCSMSGKGSVSVLASRIAATWQKKSFTVPVELLSDDDDDDDDDCERSSAPPPKKAKASTEEEFPVEFDASHYPTGVNASFLSGIEATIVQNGIDRFEDSKNRDIAKELPALVAAVDSVYPLNNKHVADLGTGTGLFTPAFAAAAGQKGKVYGVDLSPAFVAHLNAKVGTSFPANIEAVLCDEKSCKLPPHSIDAAFICDVYHHLTYPRTYMRSVLNALTENGVLAVVDFIRDEAVHKSHPPGWITSHVRAGEEAFRAEIVSAGFTYEKNVVVQGLDENYFMVFRKVAQLCEEAK